jgi:hypothetical protein
MEDPEPDYKCLGKEADRVGQDRAVFGRQEVLTDIFRHQDKRTKVKVKV